MNPAIWIKAMRVNQWTKNGVLAAALIFALGDQRTSLPLSALIIVGLAILFFSLTASAVYLINDLHDIEKDRAHPEKKKRPLAAGDITPAAAITLAILLLIIGVAGAFWLRVEFGALVLGYLGLQAAYTYWLKQIALVDVFMIAIGFVIRALCGAVVIDVPISPWLLLCTLMLAMFLALCKRRHERVVQESTAGSSRPVLEKYSTQLLDQLIAVVTSTTIACYAIYTLWPETIEKFGSANLGYTVPFVMFGLFRYLDLVYRQDLGGRPEKILLTDLPTLINIALYGLTVLAIFFVL